jgi:4-hydroxybenzoate polyprenyltransferase
MKSVRAFLELIKFEHTVFALPFAYLGMVLAANGWPGWSKFFWITFAMAAARTLAMGFNRIVDREIDSHNPRTARRPLVTGEISLRTAWTGTIVSGAALVLAAWQLGPLTLVLLPVALLFLIGYSFTKRFTEYSHFILGFTDGLAPMGAWVAVCGSLFTKADLPAWLLLVIVTLWIGGFDLIYACQDVEYDQKDNLYSMPARRGVAFSLRLSSVSHLVMVMILCVLGAVVDLGWIYWLAIGLIMLLLFWEHWMVKPDDLSRVNIAFFNINSVIGLALFAGVLGGLAF